MLSLAVHVLFLLLFFFFNDTATTEIYTLSLHDALPIYLWPVVCGTLRIQPQASAWRGTDRKSTRLNSSHGYISYAVFCLKKKYNTQIRTSTSLCVRPKCTTPTLALYC